jgi:hypothetical protein
MSRQTQEQFPDRSAEIADLYLRDAAFRELCHDHAVCMEMLRSSGLSSASSQQRESLLRELQSDLEQEIVESLDANLREAHNS